jgi:diacylglycerol kinase family enzyme
VLVVVNEQSKGAKGARRWASARDGLVQTGVEFEEVRPAGVAESDRIVVDGLARGHDVVIAVGGDGTVGAVLNALMDPATDRPRRDVALGAIGLGSSNDFHKPMSSTRRLGTLPARVSAETAARVDVGKALIHHPDGSQSVRYFLLNASVGLVAGANDYFNRGGGLMRWLKRKHTELAIMYAALINIVRYRPRPITMHIDGVLVLDEPTTNIGVLKSVHFAGGMRYDTGVTRDDGQFDVNVMEAMGKARLVATAIGLYGGKFQGRPRTRCMRGSVVGLRSPEPLPLELDGEIFPAIAAELTVLPRALKVCG